MVKKKNKLFDYLNAIFYKNDIEYDKKEAGSYIISLWLSHDKQLVDTVNRVNKYLFLLSDEAIFKYYMYKVPRGKRWIKWVKKEEPDSETKEKIEGLMEKYSMSEREARASIIK